jgi:hypothetical protein
VLVAVSTTVCPTGECNTPLANMREPESGRERMERTPNRKYAATFTLVRAGAGNSSRDDASHLRKQLDDVCIALFDRWCERRELTPLI